MPEGGYVSPDESQLRNALIDGAIRCSNFDQHGKPLQDKSAQLALLIGCVGHQAGTQTGGGRGVRDVLGDQAVFTGSVSRISPHMAGRCMQLHNQTMTITTF